MRNATRTVSLIKSESGRYFIAEADGQVMPLNKEGYSNLHRAMAALTRVYKVVSEDWTNREFRIQLANRPIAPRDERFVTRMVDYDIAATARLATTPAPAPTPAALDSAAMSAESPRAKARNANPGAAMLADIETLASSDPARAFDRVRSWLEQFSVMAADETFKRAAALRDRCQAAVQSRAARGDLFAAWEETGVPPTADALRAVYDLHGKAHVPAGFPIWGVWYHGEQGLELCEVVGMTCFETFMSREAAETSLAARPYLDPAQLTVRLIPNGVVCCVDGRDDYVTADQGEGEFTCFVDSEFICVRLVDAPDTVATEDMQRAIAAGWTIEQATSGSPACGLWHAHRNGAIDDVNLTVWCESAADAAEEACRIMDEAGEDTVTTSERHSVTPEQDAWLRREEADDASGMVPQPAQQQQANASGFFAEDADTWLARQFEFEFCEECSGDACHHTAIGFLGNWFARCDYGPGPNGEPHPVIQAYRDADDASGMVPQPVQQPQARARETASPGAGDRDAAVRISRGRSAAEIAARLPSALLSAYRWHRAHVLFPNGDTRGRSDRRKAETALSFARLDVAQGTHRYASADTRKPFDPNEWEAKHNLATPTRARYFERPADVGLRFVGYADDIRRSIRHTGWLTNGCNEKLRGCVYQLPSRDGRPIYVPAHDDEINGDANKGGPAFVYLDELHVGGIGGDEGRNRYEDENARNDCALIADRRAESEAEEERDYQEAHQAGFEAGNLQAEYRESRADTLSMLQELREVARERYRSTLVRTSVLTDFARFQCKILAKRDRLISDFGHAPGFRDAMS